MVKNMNIQIPEREIVKEKVNLNIKKTHSN